MSLNQLGLGFVFTAQDLASGVMGRIEGGLARLGATAGAAGTALRANLAQLGQGLSIAGAGLGGLVLLERSLERSAAFSESIAEISTLIDESTFSVAALTDVTLDLAATYGGSAVGQAKALYEAISSGASDAATATDLLRVANELAIGGATDTKTAVDGLTNVINAYAASGARARDVSDAFFVAILAGKTTAPELASTLGRVAPTAAALNVSFTDLLAAIAAISGQGLDTGESVTGLKAALANIIKPTSDAVKEASRLGITFDATTLRAKGLSGFLQMVTSSAQFNQDSLAKLFGSVEALNAVTALTARNSATFNTVLGQMAARGGATKAAFDRMSATLAFQTRRFQALRENAQIVIGQALEPIAAAIVRVASVLVEAFLRIPKPMRDIAVRAFAAAAVVVTLFGAFVAAKASIGLFVLAMKAAGISVAGTAASLLPLLAGFAVIALVVAGFVQAFRHDVGGIATFLGELVARAKLLFQGLGQLFSDGGFSGAVMAELGRAEHAGIKQFAIRVYQIFYRLKRFFEGVADGFAVAIDAARPAFAGFVAALQELGQALGLMGTESTDALAALGSDQYVSAGARVGKVLASIAAGIVDAMSAILRVTTGVISGLRRSLAYFQPVFEIVGQAIAFVAEAVRDLIADLSGSTAAARESGSGWSDLGTALGAVAGLLGTVVAGAIGAVALALRSVIVLVRWVVDAFMWLGRVLGENAARIYLFFTETLPSAFKAVAATVRAVFNPVAEIIGRIVDGIHASLDRLMAFVGRLVAKIPARFRPGLLDSIVEAGADAEARLKGRETKTHADAEAPAMAASQATAIPRGQAFRIPNAEVAFPGAADVRARAQINEAELDAIVARGIALSESRPLQSHVTLMVDGETLAQVTTRANRSDAARAFMPVGAAR